MRPDPAAEQLRDRLRGTLIAAAATPMTSEAVIDLDVVETYLRGLVASGADALAVLAHTGRGPFLSAAERAAVIERAVAVGVPVLVGVGGGADADAPAQAQVAAELGASGVLVFPPPGDRVAAHDAVWRAAGLPMIAFDLYTMPCRADELAAVLEHPGVAGLKTALLSDAMGCQRAIDLTRAAGRLAITGEDRMFAASLLWGAEAALVGIAAASVGTTAAVLAAYRDNDLRAFEKASTRLDALAKRTFKDPMEGYVSRMLRIAAEEGRIPEAHAQDPHRP
ncbi:dihydrodipicolinate synthase family protein [Pseudonocardia sp. TRM90224]|uniref:dihydrodipicolinate synthase family protein n=1 Tax=Pseudonocardia sp. TRM90224 TaxID=2812678 RepID=UPI001E356F03|nr:dihydrodipicolinate synthase family protein [Pseudonocardia sp. TRM90224]